jgi:hypothetical protein
MPEGIWPFYMVNPALNDLAMAKNQAKIVHPSEGVHGPTLLYPDTACPKKANQVSKAGLGFVTLEGLDQNIKFMV